MKYRVRMRETNVVEAVVEADSIDAAREAAIAGHHEQRLVLDTIDWGIEAVYSIDPMIGKHMVPTVGTKGE